MKHFEKVWTRFLFLLSLASAVISFIPIYLNTGNWGHIIQFLFSILYASLVWLEISEEQHD